MKYFLILFSTLGLLTLNSCSTEDAEKAADEFHKRLDANEVIYICDNLVDQTDATDEDRENFRSFLNGIVAMGPQKNRKKTSGFNKKYNNGVTTVKLSYTFEVKGELIYESIVLVKRDEGYKVLMVSMHPDESFVNDYTKDY